jgi:ligand-binding SRPBCC domain-containing protein
MAQIIIETIIEAPAATCFSLIRDEGVRFEAAFFRAADIKHQFDRGTVEMGQVVTFKEKLLGFDQTLTLQVVELEPARRFLDEMIDGPFREFRHLHEFNDSRRKTLMRDTLDWTLPFGILGTLADKLFVERHLRGIVTRRNERLRSLAEMRLR